jgi:2-keto-4-pentenoate hydratase
MTAEVLRKIADELAQAEATRTSIEAPSRRYPNLSVDDAYAIQRLGIDRRVEAGAVTRGHKIGLTAQAMRDLMGVQEPDYGHLLDDMFKLEGATLAVAGYIQPMVEVEPAFVLRSRLEGPGVTAADAARATEFVMPCFEIIDSRVHEWRIGFVDTVADNGSSASVVLGGRPVALTAFDPRSLQARLLVNGRVVERGNTGDILGNPVSAVAWLANALARYGVALDEGHVILPGSCIRAVPAVAGQWFSASLDVLGTVEIGFE